MSDDGIARWKQPIGAAAGFDEFEAMVQDVLQLSAGREPRSGRLHDAGGNGRRQPASPAGAAAANRRRRASWPANPAAAGPRPADAEPPPAGSRCQPHVAADRRGESRPRRNPDDAVFSVAVAKRPPLAKPAPTPPRSRGWLFNIDRTRLMSPGCLGLLAQLRLPDACIGSAPERRFRCRW